MVKAIKGRVPKKALDDNEILDFPDIKSPFEFRRKQKNSKGKYYLLVASNLSNLSETFGPLIFNMINIC